METRLDRNMLENSLLVKSACYEIIEKMGKKKILSKDLEKEKAAIARKYGMNKIPKNAEIFQFMNKNHPNYVLCSHFMSGKMHNPSQSGQVLKGSSTIPCCRKISCFRLGQRKGSGNNKRKIFDNNN